MAGLGGDAASSCPRVHTLPSRYYDVCKRVWCRFSQSGKSNVRAGYLRLQQADMFFSVDIFDCWRVDMAAEFRQIIFNGSSRKFPDRCI